MRVYLLGAATILWALSLAAETPRQGVSWDQSHGKIRVSANGRFLEHADGTPFFWLGDTAWELFHRLTRAEAEQYLENRRGKGFTVIQAVALAELDGLNTPNAHGDRPLLNNNPTTPATTPGNNPANATEYDYWDHVDYVVNTAQSKGMYIGMLPTWGSHVTGGTIHSGNAQAYGQFIGQRYASKPVIWIIGGDRNASGYEAVWRALAKGIAIGATGSEDYSQVLMTFHPPGGNSSSTWFHNDAWLDFNMLQTGHGRNTDVWNRISNDYNRAPVKPVLDGEPTYEDHPINFNTANGYATDYDVRKYAYWDLFAGAHGHTYGCHNIWQMYAPGRTAVSWAHAYWYDSLDFNGAWDMMHVRNLMLSRPFLSRVPDQSIVTNALTGGDRIQATRGDGYLFVYSASGQTFTVNLGKISGSNVKAWWFNPREGTASVIGTYANTGQRAFAPPSAGTDWVLVLDDASRSFPAPGGGTVAEPPPPPPPTPSPDFVKGINLNGNAVTIEGNPWISHAQAVSSGLSFSVAPNLAITGVSPNPATDAATSSMLNTAVWSSGSFSLAQTVANGSYKVYLWVIENHQSNYRSFGVKMEGATVASSIGTLAYGSWVKYGPYSVTVGDGALNVELVRITGDPHLMGMAIFNATAPAPTVPVVTASASDGSAAETGPDTGRFTLTRTGSTASSLAVTVSVGGTASNGSDYGSIGTTVTIPAGAASATVTVSPVDDTLVEGSETATLTVLDAAAYDVGSPSAATVTIADNDSAPPPPPPSSTFVKGINFNGGAVTIEGNPWISYSQALSSGLTVSVAPNLATTNVTPNPAADAATSSMLNTAIWSSSSFGFSQTIANGTYHVYLWVLENHQTNYRSFDVKMEGTTVGAGIGSLPYATWSKYGPYTVIVGDGALSVDLVRLTGDPHVMGMAIFSASSPTPPPPTDSFVKGVNFNGNAVTIEGKAWSSYASARSSGLSVSISPNLATTSVTPSPAADADTYAMLNSGIWSSSSFGFAQTVPNGTYSVYLWVMENYLSNVRSFDVRLEGTTVASGIGTLALGAWRKYGPYTATVGDGALSVDLVRVTGDPHVMGMAIYSGSSGGGGLSYAYYEGTWDVLPNFDALVPVKEGTVSSFDLSPRLRNDAFGFVYTATLTVASAGSYTFFTTSDDGSKLFVDGLQVVNNDGLHAAQERQGTVTLSAGAHSLAVTFFEKAGGETLSVQWQGPGIAKGPIPSSALTPDGAAGKGTLALDEGGVLALAAEPEGDSGGGDRCGCVGLEFLLVLGVAALRRRSVRAQG